ncbi:tRNA wybutosine-synthesizing protein 4 isoform X2 [Strix uralensis]|uniref:tRNA wybutosine-synthesizing protein 4 isoform X2 n=1 Tax=Strix uralensis TaxID=36305 RepID=UPI003DA6F604
MWRRVPVGAGWAAGVRMPRAPPPGYYIRARAVDHCVQDFLLKTQGHPRTQILSLGAGFDSLYFRLKDVGLLHHTVVYEVDFPNVACQKAALIKRMKELSALVGDTGGERLGVITFSGEDYKLLGVDLSELSELERALEEAGLDNEIPTLFIAEVVLTYMESSRSDALIRWAAERFPRACFLLYEQMRPGDPFGHVMQQHFSQLSSALRSLAQYPDCEAQQRRFFEQGWTECSVMDMNEFFTCCTPEDEQQRVQALEPFDEYEEWHLKCSHYFVLTASKGMEPSWTPLLSNMTVPRHDAPVRVVGSVTAAVCARHSEVPGLRRYGHHSVLIKPNVILTTGGFGEEDGQHCRMRNFHVLIKHMGCWKAGCVKQENPDKRRAERLYHTVSCLSSSLALVVGGRTSPSSAGLGMLWLKFPETCNALDPDDITVELVRLQPAAEPAALRWRHSTTEVIFKGEKYLFLYGGRSALEPVLGDWYFLHTQELSCSVMATPHASAWPPSQEDVRGFDVLPSLGQTCQADRTRDTEDSLSSLRPTERGDLRDRGEQQQVPARCSRPISSRTISPSQVAMRLWKWNPAMIPVEGPVPEGRHSHGACSWRGGVLIAGGLGAAERPLGSVFFLRELEHGFQWQRVETHPLLIPRYSHTAHVHEGKLLLVGGVWLHSSSVPGVTVIDLMTGLCLDYTINVEHLEWPLMLHNHSSVFLPDEEELLLIGGGGNCFSFGTHLNPEPVSLSLSSILTSC